MAGDPANPGWPDRARVAARAHATRLERTTVAGSYEDCLSDFQRATSSDPGFALAHLQLSYLYHLEGKPRTFAVNPEVDLMGVRAGDDVVVQYTQGLAVVVEKP